MIGASDAVDAGRLTIRPADEQDRPFLEAMTYEAAFWRPRPAEQRPPPAPALTDPHLARYVAGWGRAGDVGVVAVCDGGLCGAAWYRSFPATDHGYGFLDETTPELSIAVVPAVRRRGVGQALLATLVAQARLDGVARLSLSVEVDNPARHLYERLGFRRVTDVGGALTMAATLRA